MAKDMTNFRGPLFRYPIRSHPSYWFHTGKSSSMAMLLGILGGRFRVLTFDELGGFRGVEETSLDVGGREGIDDLADAVSQEVDRVRASRGLVDATVFIRRFDLPNLVARIEDWPEDVQDPDQSEEERTADLEAWKEAGSFVFYWNQSFFMNMDGLVTSS